MRIDTEAINFVIVQAEQVDDGDEGEEEVTRPR